MKFKKRISSPGQSTHPRLLTLYAMEADTIHQYDLLQGVWPPEQFRAPSRSLPSNVLATLACRGGAEPLAAQGMCYGEAKLSARVLEGYPGAGDRLAPFRARAEPRAPTPAARPARTG